MDKERRNRRLVLFAIVFTVFLFGICILNYVLVKKVDREYSELIQKEADLCVNISSLSMNINEQVICAHHIMRESSAAARAELIRELEKLNAQFLRFSNNLQAALIYDASEKRKLLSKQDEFSRISKALIDALQKDPGNAIQADAVEKASENYHEELNVYITQVQNESDSKSRELSNIADRIGTASFMIGSLPITLSILGIFLMAVLLVWLARVRVDGSTE